MKQPRNESFILDVNFLSEMQDNFEKYKNYEKRDCFENIQNYMNSTSDKPEVCILYGLRRTGKTILMYQSMMNLPKDKLECAAYINIAEGDDIVDLFEDLKSLKRSGIKYIYIDEITYFENFIRLSEIFSNKYVAIEGMKFVFTGTDSLGFYIAEHNELYDRCKMIHTTEIPFSEFKRLTGISDIQDYIKNGGTLNIEEQKKERNESKKNYINLSLNKDKISKYTKISIAQNIQNTLEYIDDESEFYDLYALHHNAKLSNVINRIVMDNEHRFAKRVLIRKFKMHDFGDGKDIIIKRSEKNYNTEQEQIMWDKSLEIVREIDKKENKEELRQGVMNILDILDYINPDDYPDSVLKATKEYMKKLDVITCHDCVYRDNDSKAKARKENIQIPMDKMYEERIFITQPGLRYAQVEVLLNQIHKYPNYINATDEVQNCFDSAYDEAIQGRMIEDVVLHETIKNMDQKKEEYSYMRNDNPYSKYFIHTYNYSGLGEFDMVVLNAKTKYIDLYEIKRTDKPFIEQKKNFMKDELINKLLDLYDHVPYKIHNKTVLYRGPSFNNGDCIYMNIENYLETIPKGYDKILEQLEILKKTKIYLCNEDGKVTEIEKIVDESIKSTNKIDDSDSFDL